MALELGTRVQQNQRQLHTSHLDQNGGYSADTIGMSKRYPRGTAGKATVTFSGTDLATLSNSFTYPAWAVGDTVIISGSNLNDGEHKIKTINAGAFTVNFWDGVKAEGPVNVEIRTP